MTAAWNSALLAGEEPASRILVVNPEGTKNHVPESLRDLQMPEWPQNQAEFTALALKILVRVRALEGALEIADLDRPRYHGMQQSRAPRFVGRVKQLWELHGGLTRHRTCITTGAIGQSVVQVRGLGGNGKSLLAREYAIRFGPAYPGGIFWLKAYGNEDGKSRQNRRDQIRQFAVELAIGTGGKDPGDIEVAFWERLTTARQPYLLIIDDLPADLEAAELEKLWIAPWPRASTLITTRSRTYDVGTCLDLGGLEPSEAEMLLKQHGRPEEPDVEEALRSIAKELGYHPLAVDVAGGYLSLGVQSVGAYLEAIRRPDVDAVEFGAQMKQMLPTGHERSISATLLRSLKQLGPEGLDFLRMASVLSVAAIPVSLAGGVILVSDSLTVEATHSWLTRALNQVDSLSLCIVSGDGCAVHTLVSRALRFYGANARRGWRLTSWFRAVSHRRRITRLRRAAMLTLVQRLEYAAQGQQYTGIENELAHGRRLAASCGADLPCAALAELLGLHALSRGDYGDGQRYSEQVLSVRRRLLGDSHSLTLMAKQNLALSIINADPARACALLEEVSKERERRLGDRHLDTLRTKNNLGQVLIALGKPEEAQRLQEDLLKVGADVLPAMDPSLLVWKHNLAKTLLLTGRLEAAQQLAGDVVDISSRLLGSEHLDTVTAKVLLGTVMLQREQYPEALRVTKEAFEVSRRALGDENLFTLSTALNMALAMHHVGNQTDARRLIDETLDKARVFPENDPCMLELRNALAELSSLIDEVDGTPGHGNP